MDKSMSKTRKPLWLLWNRQKFQIKLQILTSLMAAGPRSVIANAAWMASAVQMKIAPMELASCAWKDSLAGMASESGEQFFKTPFAWG